MKYDTIKHGKIMEILTEVNCTPPEDLDLHKIAVEIDELYNPICLVCGAHKANYREMMHRDCVEDHGIGSIK